jgi:transcriptional regulator with XRE-family HTH domain
MRTGELIRSARNRAGLSQAELAERLGMPVSSIARWETDRVEPGFSKLRRVLQACGFDIPPVREARVQEVQRLSPEERLAAMMQRLEKR